MSKLEASGERGSGDGPRGAGVPGVAVPGGPACWKCLRGSVGP